MYGLVNKAIKDLVVQLAGEEKWLEICQLSNNLLTFTVPRFPSAAKKI
ncbi:MAG: hypothetical protein FJZ78_11205 [Bacteroidetes bacterium]|nr:hypothetical protein [Bacteroidota bacterium]